MNAHVKKPLLLKTLSFSLALTLAGVTLPLYAYKVYDKKDYTDFDVYYRAAQRVKDQKWNEVYTLQDGASPFRYSPLIIPLFRPFAYLEAWQAKLVWYFLQYFWFSLGFYFIFKSIRLCRQKKADFTLAATSLSVLFILRFCLDTFTIGQVSSLMFLGFSVGLYGWMCGRPQLASVGLAIPTLLKIGPGFLFGVFLSARNSVRKKAFFAALTTCVSLSIFSLLQFRPWELYQKLFSGWLLMVASDSDYYDASHYGSQSFKSFLLREVRWGQISPETAQHLYVLISIFACLSVSLFWALRKPKSTLGKGLFFSLGIFIYLWVMPETFKYSLTSLAIPVALLFHSFFQNRRSRLTGFALLFGAGTLSLAGMDIVGDFLFFGLQNYSIPLLATLFLGAAVFQEAWQESKPSFLGQLFSGPESIGPWEKLPNKNRNLDISLLIPLPLEEFSQVNPALAVKWIEECKETFKPLQFEILVIPYGNRKSEFHPLFKIFQNLEQIRLLQPPSQDGRGLALRHGFLESRGHKILIAQLEQPCHPSFYTEAIALLDQGTDLVRANRRVATTQFKLPVRVLSQIYGRHRLGLLFNRLLRFVLPIQTTDTHSGTLALTWKLAHHVFSVQTAANFLFELELCLASHIFSAREKDLPVFLNLENEKKSRRVFLEVLTIALYLPRIIFRYYRGFYQSAPLTSGITADDWGISEGVNQGILRLAQLGIVRRVSLMANCPYLEVGLKELCQIPGIELGLHFNLTYGRSLSTQSDQNSSPLRFLFRFLSQDLKQEVRKEFSLQLKKISDLKVPLNYIDGHHHIHLVPGIIDLLAPQIQQSGIQKVRLPYDPTLWKTSQAPIAFLSILARRKFKKYGFHSLPCIYPKTTLYTDQGKLRALLAKRLSQTPSAEIIVHPAEINDFSSLEFPDHYTSGRVIEFQALCMFVSQDASP